MIQIPNTGGFTTAVLQQVLQKLGEIETLLPFLIQLTEDERKSLAKVADKRRAFIEKYDTYVRSHPEFVPPIYPVATAESNLDLFHGLTQIVGELTIVFSKMDDTRLASGSIAYVDARHYYNIVHEAVEANVSGARAIYEDMKTLFEGQGNFADEDNPADNLAVA